MYNMSDYPDSLLPKKEYKPDMQIEDKEKNPHFHLSRRLDMPLDKATFMNGPDKCLNLAALETIDERCSMNMLGAGFEKEHTKLRQTGDAAKRWDGQDIPDKNVFSEFVSFDESASVLVYDSMSLYNEFPYSRTFQKSGEATELAEKLAAIGAMAKKNLHNPKMLDEVVAKSFLKHSPTVINYWHVEFQIKPSEVEMALKNVSSAWKKDLLRNFRQRCFEYFESESTKIASVEEKWYMLP